MKKIIALSAAAVMLGGAISVQAMSQAKLTVTDGGDREISFVNDTTDAASTSVKNVLYTLGDLSSRSSKSIQAFEVMSEVDEDGAVDVYLRLSTESSTVNALEESTKLLRTYEIVVKDSADEVIFDSGETELEIKSPEAGEYVADIFLGRFNEEELAESNVYNLYVAVPTDATANEIKKAKNISWEIVSDPVEEGATPIPVVEEEEEEPTQAPAATAAPTAAPKPTAAPTAAPVSTEAPAGATEAPVEAISSGERIIGDGDGEIKAGKYTAEAREEKANIKIYDEDGELAREIELDESNPSKVITLKNGQKLVYEGGVNLVPYKSDSASASTSTSSTGSSTAGNAKATTKTNPKTGDTAPIACVSVAAVFALGMLAYPEIEKRRKNN